MQRSTVTWLVVGVIAWGGLILLVVRLATTTATGAGFDLELLLDAGRAVAAGRSPYDPDMLSGSSPTSTSLFYSYPPPIAQALSPLASVPSPVMLGAWWVVAAAGALAAGEGLRRRLAPSRRPLETAIALAASLPLTLPLAVGLLFGNLDAWFPMLYGVMLLAAVAPSSGTVLAGGLALVVASLKLHPASLGLWFLVRARRSRDGGARRVVAVSAAGGAAVLALSLALGGSALWRDYALVVQAGTGAEFIDPRNAGPASVIASLLGGGEGLARALQVVVSLAAVGITAVAAWRLDDQLESLTLAAVASLVTLPVTWYHYPSALIPFALAAVLRAPTAVAGRVRILVAAAGLVAAVGLSILPLLWLAAALVIAAAHASKGTERTEVVRAIG